MAEAAMVSKRLSFTQPTIQPSARVAGRCMPLTFLHAGEQARVQKVRGSGELHHHLENLGFVPGASVSVMSQHAGSVIVQVKGTQVALDKSAASKVMTVSVEQ